MARVSQIQVRRDTAATWTSVNPTLTLGEPGYESDTRKLKFGDGSTAWTGLPYFSTGLLATVATSGLASDLTGTLAASQLPAHTGDVTSSAGSAAPLCTS